MIDRIGVLERYLQKKREEDRAYESVNLPPKERVTYELDMLRAHFYLARCWLEEPKRTGIITEHRDHKLVTNYRASEHRLSLLDDAVARYSFEEKPDDNTLLTLGKWHYRVRKLSGEMTEDGLYPEHHYCSECEAAKERLSKRLDEISDGLKVKLLRSADKEVEK